MSLAQVTEEWERLVMFAITGDKKLPHNVGERMKQIRKA